MSGDFCELDYNGCQDNPCTHGTNCTDVRPAEEAASGRTHNCSACPAGTEYDDGTCLREDYMLCCRLVLSCPVLSWENTG